MLQAALRRTTTGDEGTPGELNFPGFTCKTLELPWRENAPALSSIPEGVYRVEMTWSNRFKRKMYEVLDVPSRAGVRIHSGNFAGDTTQGLQSHVEGCVLLGKSFGQLRNRAGQWQFAILASGVALVQFASFTRGRPFELTISGQPVAIAADEEGEEDEENT